MHNPDDLGKMQYKELWTAFDEAEGEEEGDDDDDVDADDD